MVLFAEAMAQHGLIPTWTVRDLLGTELTSSGAQRTGTHTGVIGDGVIFINPVPYVMGIRTEDRNSTAL